MTTFGCVVTAAGSGERFGADVPKTLVPIGGIPVVTHAVSLMRAEPRISPIVVTAPAASIDTVRDVLADLPGVVVVPGGGTRTDSVRRGVAALPEDVAGIVVHDAARPFVPPRIVAAVLDAIDEGADGAVPGLPVVDTIKEVGPDDTIVATPTRSRLRAVQTPQAFRADLLRRGLALHTTEATDDAQLVELAGGVVRVVPGHPDGLKITTKDDLARAAAILAGRGSHVG